jgi:twinkle protein
MRKVWEGMPTKEDIGGDRWNQIADHCNSNYFHIDMERYTLDSVLRKGAELVKRKGIKCLVIDPFNKVRDVGGSDDVNRYTMEYLQKIEIFAKKYDVLVFIVAHPTKMYKNQKTGEIDEPTMYSIKGGGEWYDASYHGILVIGIMKTILLKLRCLRLSFKT